MTFIGERLPRKEDPRLLRGLGRFGDDQDRPGQLWMRVVRSPVAHGRIVSISAPPGVITAADLPSDLRIPVRLKVQDIDLDEFLQPVLASQTVRYVGEPVAVVLADDPYEAEDIAEQVEIEFDELPVAVETGDGQLAAEFELGYGDVEQAFQNADHVVEIEFDVGRHSAVPLEPRALLADVDPATGALQIFGMTKVPVFNRDVLSRMLGIDENLIHVHAMDAGGGFGVRGEFYPEDFLVPWLARKLCKPVKWVEDRAEHLVAVNHSRQQRHVAAAAFDKTGTLLALRDEVLHDNGAYARTHGIIVPELTVAMFPGPYRVPVFNGRIRVMLTNKTPCGTYRAPGRFEGTAVREQLLDVAADRLGIDRVELRRKNLLAAGELPHTREMSTLGTDVVLDSGDYIGLLDKAMVEADRLGYFAEVEKLRAGRQAGLGVAMFLEKSGLGPQETADVMISPSGDVRVHSGGTSLGQGIETALAQVTADALGVDPAVITVINGDTNLQPFGGGSWASRSTVVGGSAVHRAALAVRQRAVEIASRMLEVAEEDLEVRNGAIGVKGAPGSSVTFADVAKACRPGSPHLLPDEPAGLTERRRFEVEHMTYPYGVHIVLVDVDAATGQVKVLRYLVAYEVGRAINPTMVEGQLLGGVAQGVGGALLEEFRYDDAGQPQAVTFMDYLMPTAAELPPIDILVAQDAPAPGNPLGVKGAGEGGLTAAGAAIAGAIRDALGLTGSVGCLPMTAERVRGLIKEGK
ncbi:carbon-monoxide dehydrogenase large subunit/6-hydroxypseudooxynicotine dehydrogenase subunit gamma [Kibdelosporangium banguiense]|uniref:Carbon-monoxide dehydrogenase large subunit/6-hydroxypseudooxynicotine dehydrogenase subunit gamma n=1 Tax=Kibdelosporangium banguiense TaxID=1365924 RepID=A0ABS4TC33_9PSEU|nr:xanthine dehydrogenase family protein molybdopterin-binding subunit [Kibdelosporangium banguiense]MBP2321993.1 carbon-monoxide dehydrogenase large subunit/6-hydroxypseudooxynicotine dehydrogenase subunit gamma [Kibdelosporangium banguiense]